MSQEKKETLLPPPELLERYESISKGLSKDLVELVKKEQEHRHKLQDKYLMHFRCGQFFGALFLIAVIYLVFDFEPHYHKYEDSKIKDILNVFNNETELGKLYINYPMVESFYYLKNIPDLEYLGRKISLNNFNGKDYKKLVNNETILKKNKLSNKQLCYIIWINYNKVRKIINSEEINHELILDEQLKLKKAQMNYIY